MHTKAEITYNTIDTGNFALAEHSEIASMASLCPYEYGPPVYFARAWLRANGDTLEYANVCEMGYISEKSRITQNLEKPNEEIRAVFYPNPTNNSGVLFIPLKENQSALVRVYNAQAAELMQFSLKEKHNSLLIDLSSYPAGIYYYSILTNDERTSNGKILLIR